VLFGWLVSLRTTPKTDDELVGLVHALPAPDDDDEVAATGWYRSPAILGGTAIGLSVLGYIVFSIG
jgi:SSS family solute:Na+ symporter